MTTRRVHQTNKDKIGKIALRIELLENGPCVAVLIGLAQSIAAQLAPHGQSVPDPVSGWALIDTGATTTCIDDQLAQSLRLPVIDEVPILSASHADTKVYVYPTQMEVADHGKVDVPRAIGANLKPSGLVALLGRDYLQHCVLNDHGITGEFTLSLWDANISHSGRRIKRH